MNGMSTLAGYLMPKLSSAKNWTDTIYLIVGWINEFIAFTKVISLKINVVARLEFELVYCEPTVQYFSHYATGTLLEIVNGSRLLTNRSTE